MLPNVMSVLVGCSYGSDSNGGGRVVVVLVVFVVVVVVVAVCLGWGEGTDQSQPILYQTV